MAKRKNPQQSKQSRPAAVTERWGLARKVAWWSLLTMVFITPIAISNLSALGFALPLSYDQFDIIKVFCQRVFTLIALGAFAWDMLVRGGKLRRTPVDWLILAFLAWVTISTVFSIHPATAFFGKYRRFEGLLSFINYAVIYFLFLQLADTPTRIKRVAQTVFWSGLVVALYGVLQAIGRDPLSWGQLPFEQNRSFSTYGNPDLLGGFLMFSTFISMGLVFAEKNVWKRALYWFGFLLNAVVIVTAFTRSAWVGAVVGFVCFVVLAIRQKAPWEREDWVFSAVATALPVGFVIRSMSSTNEVMNFGRRVASIFEFGQGSARTRFEIWSAAGRALKDRPIFGFGPDTFRLIFPRYKPVEYVRDAGYLSVADNVHNYPLQLATGIGIPGVAMFYGIMGWAAARTFKLVWTRDGSPSRMVLVGFWTACAAYIVHLFFGLSVTGASFLLWVSLAAVLSPTADTVEVKPLGYGVLVAAVVSLLAFAGIVYQFVYLQADQVYLKARIASEGASRTAFAKEAARLNPYNDMYRAEVGLALSDELISIINNSSGQTDQATAIQNASIKFKEAEASLKDTIAFVPWEYDNYVFLANLYNMGGQFLNKEYLKDAIAIGEQGVKVEPFGPAIRVQLARAYETSGNLDKAIEHFKIAHDMDPAYGDAALALANDYEKQGRIAEAIAALKETEAAAPGTAGVADMIKRLESVETSSK